MSKASESQSKLADALYNALANDDLATAKTIVNDLHVAEIADIIENVPSPDRAAIWRLIDLAREGEILANMQDGVQAEFLAQMQPNEVADATKYLETDEIVDILQKLPDDKADTILRSMDEQNRQRLEHVLTYPEDTAGGLMNTDVISVRADVSLDVVARYLRRLKAIPEKTDKLIVVDRNNYYLGVLPLTELLIQNQDSTVAEWIKADPSLVENAATTDVARLFERRDLISAAVVDEHNILLGRITVDDVVDVIQQQAEQAVRSMAGLGDEDLFSPVLISSRRRAIWLGINLLTAFLAAAMIALFQASIAKLVALAVLMPVVAGMGGIAGTQTLTVAIRAIALGQIGKQNIKPLIIKELTIGVLNGALWAVVVASCVILWFDDRPLGLIIGVAMLVNLSIAALAGATIPLALKHYGIDPAIAGGVILTTVTDCMGFITFLGLATIFLI